MDLILWRHAEAEDSSPDMDRVLTLKGKKQAEKIANFLRLHLPPETRILVSPAKRTVQTASAFSENFTLAPSIAPGASAHAILQAARWPNGLARSPHPNLPPEGEGANASLRDHKNPAGTVLIVGHQPTLGAVAALLLGSAESSLSIKKGSLWWFTRRARDDYAQTTLRAVITADFL